MRDTNILTDNGINVQQALEMLGDMEMYDETLGDFLDLSDEKITSLENFKNANDMPNYAIAIHALKSDGRYLGFTTLADLAYESEMKSKAGDSVFVQENHPKILQEAKRVINLSQQYMGREVTEVIPSGALESAPASTGAPQPEQQVQSPVTQEVAVQTAQAMPQAQVAQPQMVQPQQVQVQPQAQMAYAQPTQAMPQAQVAQPQMVQPQQVQVQPQAQMAYAQPTQAMPQAQVAQPQMVQPQQVQVQPQAQMAYAQPTQAMPQAQVAQPQMVQPQQVQAQPQAQMAYAQPAQTVPQAPVTQPAEQKETIQFFPADDYQRQDIMSQALYMQQQSQAATPVAAVKKGIILVVDDSPLVANFVKKIFSANYDVIIANDGQKAIETINDENIRSKIKTCLLDLNMPNVSGFDVMDHFREKGFFVRTPVAVISGAEDEETLDKVKGYPIVDILAKPFNERDVQRVVEKCLAVYF